MSRRGRVARTIPTGQFDGHLCRLCHKYWSSIALESCEFLYIDKYCPDCIAGFPVWELEPLTGPSWLGFRPGHLPGETVG